MALLFLDSFDPAPCDMPHNYNWAAVPRRVRSLVDRCPAIVEETPTAYIIRPDLSVLTDTERADVIRHFPYLR